MISYQHSHVTYLCGENIVDNTYVSMKVSKFVRISFELKKKKANNCMVQTSKE